MTAPIQNLSNRFFQMDWDMAIGSGSNDDYPLPVDLVTRQQPESDHPEVTVATATGPTSGVSDRRRIIHRVSNLDGFDPICGNCFCCIQ